MGETASHYTPEEQFNATLLTDGGYVSIVSRTLADLVKTVAQLRPTESAGKSTPAKPAGTSIGEAVAATLKPKQKEAAAPTPKQEAALSPSPALTPAESTVAPATGDEPARPTYDDIKRAVLALAKISPETAKATLAKFTGQNGQPCDHGTKLKLEDYPAFLKAAEEVTA
jgi:hypothetical protein